MKRMIAATFALIGLALSTGAFAAPSAVPLEPEREVVSADELRGELVQGEPGPEFTCYTVTHLQCRAGEKILCQWDAETCAGECHCEVL